MFPPLRAGGGWENGQSIHMAQKSPQPSPPLALCKKAAGCHGLRSNRQRRLDLDRLTPFCYFPLWRGLRWIKPRRADSLCALAAHGGTLPQGGKLSASPLCGDTCALAAPWRHSPPLAAYRLRYCALRRFSGDFRTASKITAHTEDKATVAAKGIEAPTLPNMPF